VTDAPNFSLHSATVWNGTESVLVWDDRRFEGRNGSDVRLFGQRVGFDGKAIGGNMPLTQQGTLAEISLHRARRDEGRRRVRIPSG